MRSTLKRSGCTVRGQRHVGRPAANQASPAQCQRTDRPRWRRGALAADPRSHRCANRVVSTRCKQHRLHFGFESSGERLGHRALFIHRYPRRAARRQFPGVEHRRVNGFLNGDHGLCRLPKACDNLGRQHEELTGGVANNQITGAGRIPSASNRGRICRLRASKGSAPRCCRSCEIASAIALAQ